jgi:hypothetical protein
MKSQHVISGMMILWQDAALAAGALSSNYLTYDGFRALRAI